jgi:hypothetical protein
MGVLKDFMFAASLYPSAARTPGWPNRAVTQATIKSTICVKGWTATVRPPSSYTTTLKKLQMHDWHLAGGTGDYEEDDAASLRHAPRDPNDLSVSRNRLFRRRYRPLRFDTCGSTERSTG